MKEGTPQEEFIASCESIAEKASCNLINRVYDLFEAVYAGRFFRHSQIPTDFVTRYNTIIRASFADPLEADPYLLEIAEQGTGYTVRKANRPNRSLTIYEEGSP